jgi:hypothetical protein
MGGRSIGWTWTTIRLQCVDGVSIVLVHTCPCHTRPCAREVVSMQVYGVPHLCVCPVIMWVDVVALQILGSTEAVQLSRQQQGQSSHRLLNTLSMNQEGIVTMLAAAMESGLQPSVGNPDSPASQKGMSACNQGHEPGRPPSHIPVIRVLCL